MRWDRIAAFIVEPQNALSLAQHLFRARQGTCTHDSDFTD